MFLGSNMHVMIPTLGKGDCLCLPYRLSIMNTYTMMATGSKWAAVVVKNLTAAPIANAKGAMIAQVLAVNATPQVRYHQECQRNLTKCRFPESNQGKHKIKVIDNEPFKEGFQRIPPPMVEGGLCSWWKKCWKWVWFAQARALGAMLLC